jgi:hypothetical protein
MEQNIGGGGDMDLETIKWVLGATIGIPVALFLAGWRMLWNIHKNQNDFEKHVIEEYVKTETLTDIKDMQTEMRLDIKELIKIQTQKGPN